MALRTVVVNLWNGPDTLHSIDESLKGEIPDDEYGGLSRIRVKERNEEWRATVENEVKARVSELVLPESLKKRMKLIVRPIGLQIKDWKMFMASYLSDSQKYLDMKFLEQLYWTSAGAIDYKKTAEKIVCHEKFDVVTRYKFACSFCLVDSIPILQEKLPEGYKKNFRDETNLMRYFDMPLEFYWNYVLKGREHLLEYRFEKWYPSRNLTFYQYALQRSACQGNKGATEYFFQKLTDKERDDFLIGTVYGVAVKCCNPNTCFQPLKFPQRNLSEVLHYLLSVMSPVQQIQVLKTHAVEILPCFLHYPCHDLFLDVADFVWTFLSDIKYGHLAHNIHENLRNEGYYFPDMIQKFLRCCPSNFMKLFVWEFHSWFSELSHADDTETVQVIIRNIDLDYRAQIVSSNWFLKLLKGLIKENKWHLVEQCLRDAALSEDDKKSLEGSVYMYVLETFEGEELRQAKSRMKRCFELLEETIKSASNMKSS